MFSQSPPATADVVVIGAGIVGACCGYELAARGLSVLIVDRGAVAAGTTAAGEGNLLVSDKTPGPELTLATLSLALWRELPDRLTADLGHVPDLELEDKGGLMVARTEAAATALRALAETQRKAGVTADEVAADAVPELEPHLTRELATTVYYPQDQQVQPVLAATAILAAAVARGATVAPDAEVTGVERTTGGLRVQTTTGPVSTPAVVVAAGPWSGRIAALAQGRLPVEPRRGLVLVTEPLPPTVRHKVYDAGYVADVGSADAGLASSAVVEATRAGTVLIGSTRERIGFDDSVRVAALRLLAAGAVALFPVLGAATAIRAYGGFRPYSPDHLPVIGPDPAVPGLWYATGHEGAGIGLAPATGRLLGELFVGAPPSTDPTPFAADRPSLSAAAPSTVGDTE
ncbi:MAG TPA: FAD-binding oxidoreductase [Actinocatenispora sp.]